MRDLCCAHQEPETLRTHTSPRGPRGTRYGIYCGSRGQPSGLMTRRRLAPPQQPLDWQGASTAGAEGAVPVAWCHSALREVDPCDLLHPLHHALWTAPREIGRLAQQVSAATEG